MRLVIDLQGAQTGSRFRGIGRYSLSLAKAIARIGTGHEILIVLSSLFPETIEPIRAEFADLLPRDNIRIWCAVGPTREDDSANKLRRDVAERVREAFLASLQPDVVLVTSLFEGLMDDGISSIGVLDHVTPTAVVLYDLIPLVSPDVHFRTSPIHRIWYSGKVTSLKRSNLLLSISESSRQEALRTGYFQEKSVVTILAACDQAFRMLNLSADERNATWSKFGIEKPFVMYTGGADERKNLDRLIEAYAKMPAGLRQVHQLVIAGKIPSGLTDGLLLIARKLGLAQNEILLTGYVDDIDLVRLYNTCALFVFPSVHEGFGLPPLEAMACGAPVIAANATSLPEVVGLSEAMFDPASVSDMCSKMRHALTDAAFRAKLVDHGRQQHQRYSWEQCATSALAAMERMVNARSQRASSLLNFERTSSFERRRLRVLAIKLDHLGDFILAIPALSKLRAKYPYATLDVVVGGWNIPIAKGLKIFDNIYSYDFFRQKSSDAPKENEDALTQLLESLGRYDIAIDLRRQVEGRFLLARISAEIKIGYATFDAAINSKLDVALPVYPEAAFKATPLNKTSISLQMLRVVDAIPPNPNDFVVFPELGNGQDRKNGTVAIFPKAGSSVREWSRANFEELVHLLAGDSVINEIEVYFTNDTEASGFAFQSHPKVKVMAGLSFVELSRALSRNSVCITNNSGGGHLASYLGVTVIGIYSGHELATEWGPQFFDSIVVHRAAQCSPCRGGAIADCPNEFFCLTDISVIDIYRKAVEAIYVNGRKSSSSWGTRDSDISLQRNTDSIVNGLLSSIARLGDIGAPYSVEIAEAVSRNHPEFSMTPNLRSFTLNRIVDHRSSQVDWKGFSTIERKFRWSDGYTAAMSFECPEETSARGIVHLHIATLGRQRIMVSLNNIRVVDTVEAGRHIRLRIPVRNLKIGLNSLEFELPDAKTPDNGDTRRLAIAVRDFRVQVNACDPVL
jgi:glycosyltransferase involved in cell wall biosynthesis/ADP-heptose:LPS heptosyltransferase